MKILILLVVLSFVSFAFCDVSSQGDRRKGKEYMAGMDSQSFIEEALEHFESDMPWMKDARVLFQDFRSLLHSDSTEANVSVVGLLSVLLPVMTSIWPDLMARLNAIDSTAFFQAVNQLVTRFNTCWSSQEKSPRPFSFSSNTYHSFLVCFQDKEIQNILRFFFSSESLTKLSNTLLLELHEDQIAYLSTLLNGIIPALHIFLSSMFPPTSASTKTQSERSRFKLIKSYIKKFYQVLGHLSLIYSRDFYNRDRSSCMKRAVSISTLFPVFQGVIQAICLAIPEA